MFTWEDSSWPTPISSTPFAPRAASANPARARCRICTRNIWRQRSLRRSPDRNDLDTAEVDDIIWSTSTQKGKQGGDLGRMAALDAGYDVKASGMTLDRFCGGGITTVNLGCCADHVGHGGFGYRRRHRDDELYDGTITAPKNRLRALHPALMGIGSGNARLRRGCIRKVASGRSAATQSRRSKGLPGKIGRRASGWRVSVVPTGRDG